MSAGTPESLILVARVVGIFGVKGDVKVTAADPDALRAGFSVFVRGRDGALKPYTLTAVRKHKTHLVLRFAGVEDAGAAGALSGAELLAARNELGELPPFTYRQADLVGMQVIDAMLGELGAVQAVRRYPNCDMLVVGEREMLVPLLHAYEVRVDAIARRIFTRLPSGFEELR